MIFPEGFIESINYCEGFDKDNFQNAHSLPAEISVRINPFKPTEQFESNEKIPWCDGAFYLEEKPRFIFDPLIHAGAYYVQEASSMFLEHAIKNSIDLSGKIVALDLCAAPGGKSTIISSLTGNNNLLVSNEVIRQRATILKENIIKWNSFNTVVTNSDPSHFKRLENFFDVIVVDAPCSGSGLFRKEPEAMKEWSLENVNHCSFRQKRILADIIPSLKPGGKLFYSTCSYSEKENEEIADWLCEEFDLESVRLPIEKNWGIEETLSKNVKAHGYRFYPGKTRGEGFFMAVFQKKDNLGNSKFYNEKNILPATKKEITSSESFITGDEIFFYAREKDELVLLNKNLIPEISVLKKNLHCINIGTEAGKFIRDEFLPSHALALTGFVNKTIPLVNLNLEEAIRFLRRDDLKISTEKTGWHLVRYKNHNLGWIKSLGNRINNYYPKEWRILKQYHAL